MKNPKLLLNAYYPNPGYFSNIAKTALKYESPLMNINGIYLTTEGGKKVSWMTKENKKIQQYILHIYWLSLLPFSWFRYMRVSTKHGTEQHFYVSNVTQIIFLNFSQSATTPWNSSHSACIQSCHFKRVRRNNTGPSPEGKHNPDKKKTQEEI